MEAPMETKQAFESGGSRYYVVQKDDRIVVQRRSWAGRYALGEVENLEEAFGLIRQDSGSRRVQPK